MDTNEFSIGQTVEITDEHSSLYDFGTKAKLTKMDPDGDWWADFNDMGNPAGTFDDDEGIWCIGRANKHFKRAD